MRRPSTPAAKSCATLRRRRGSATRARSIVRPTAERARIRLSDSTSGSSGIAGLRRRRATIAPARSSASARRTKSATESVAGRAAWSMAARASATAICFGRGVERAGERVADGLARGRKRGANCAEQRGLVGGRKRRPCVRREHDNLGVDARRGTEIAGGDAEMLARLPVERGENAQRRVRAFARTRADALGDLALEHQDHPPDRAAHLVEPAQDRARPR